MANVKFSELDLTTLDALSSIVGIKDNGDGTFTNYRFSSAQITSFVLANSRKVITAATANIGAGGTTLTDAFFSDTINEIVTNSQAYILGIDFTQTGTTITALNFGFYDTQKLIAKK